MSIAASFPAGATIQRTNRPADHFTIVSNQFARDERLSFAARGLGLWLLSHEDGWQTSSTAIARHHAMGRDQVRRLLVELEHHRYLRRSRVRAEGGTLGGMLYQIQCTPFEPDPEENPSSDQGLNGQVLVAQSPAGAHHKKTSSKNNTSQNTNPSGGSPSGSANAKEAAMTRQPATAQALFDIDPPPGEPERKAPGANDVVAAYVDSYRRSHSGGNPTQRDIGRIARDAKALLEAGKAAPAELITAATAMGIGPYSNLGVQLNMVRERRSPHHGRIAPPSPREAFDEAGRAAHLKFLAEIKEDPTVAAWVAEDPAAVAQLVAEDPSLEAVFARVTAA